MNKKDCVSILACLCICFFTTKSFAASCLKQCKAENLSYIKNEKMYPNSKDLTFICNARCKNSGCTAKSVAEYLSEPKKYDFSYPQCVRDYHSSIDIDAVRARSAELDESIKRNREEAEARMRDLQRQPAPQATTQTSQNNYPSSSSNSNNNESYAESTSQNESFSNKQTTEGVPFCVKVGQDKNGTQVFKNVCSNKISLYWCVGYECTSNNGRLIHLKASGQYNVMAGDKEYFYAACPDPYLPNARPNGTFDGKNYSCEK